MKIIALIVTLSLPIAGCASGSSATSMRNIPLGTHFQLRPGEQVHVDDRITVGFDSVAEETRCPQGVECVWEGNATVDLTYASPDHRLTSFALNTSSRYIRDTTIQGYNIKLVDLYPHRQDYRQMVKEDYTAEMIVVKSQ